MYRENLQSRRASSRKNLTQSYCFWAPDYPEYEYEIVVETELDPDQPTKVAQSEVEGARVDILTEKEIQDGKEIDELSDSFRLADEVEQECQIATDEPAEAATRVPPIVNEKLTPAVAQPRLLPCTPGGRPKFCSYYGMGNKSRTMTNKKTFNVKAPTGVHNTALFNQSLDVQTAKMESLKRVPRPKTVHADAPYNRWLTAYQVAYKQGQPKLIKPKIRTY